MAQGVWERGPGKWQWPQTSQITGPLTQSRRCCPGSPGRGSAGGRGLRTNLHKHFLAKLRQHPQLHGLPDLGAVLRGTWVQGAGDRGHLSTAEAESLPADGALTSRSYRAAGGTHSRTTTPLSKIRFLPPADPRATAESP